MTNPTDTLTIKDLTRKATKALREWNLLRAAYGYVPGDDGHPTTTRHARRTQRASKALREAEAELSEALGRPVMVTTSGEVLDAWDRV